MQTLDQENLNLQEPQEFSLALSVNIQQNLKIQYGSTSCQNILYASFVIQTLIMLMKLLIIWLICMEQS